MEPLNLKHLPRRHGRPSSARTPRSEDDDHREARRKKEKDDHRDRHRDSSSDDSSDEDDWTEHVDNAKTVEEGMKALWECDPETFYIYGDRIEKMLQYKLDRNYQLSDEDDERR